LTQRARNSGATSDSDISTVPSAAIFIEALALDIGQQQDSFANQWKPFEVRIV
jgi:hypothetical protein